MNLKKEILVPYIFILSLSFAGCTDENKNAENESALTGKSDVESVDYEIVRVEDQSRKALGKKSLSQYQSWELEKLPTNKKVLYRVVFSKEVKENQIKPTVEEIIAKLTSDDSDIDEIILWLYSDKEIANSAFDIGTAIWAPSGKLGNIDANIAKNNNREKYKINYQLINNLDQYLARRLETEDKLGFTVEERKQLFREIVKAEDKADKYEQIEQDKVLRKFGSINEKNREMVKGEYYKISDQAQELASEYKSIILKKHNITSEQLDEIGKEGLDKHWPMD